MHPAAPPRLALGGAQNLNPVAAPSIDRKRRWAPRIPVTAGLVAVILAGYVVMRWTVHDPEALERWASTNLVNLYRRPVVSLVASAFLSSSGIPFDRFGLALAAAVIERRVGGVRMLGTVAAGHVLATLATEGAVGLAILAGYESTTAAWQMDVGISYLSWTAIGAALAFAPRLWRPWAVMAAVLYLGAHLAVAWDMTAWGHVLSLLIGFASWPLLRHAARRRLRAA